MDKLLKIVGLGAIIGFVTAVLSYASYYYFAGNLPF